MDAIEELIARDKIRQLAERYAFTVDGKDIDGVAELFLEGLDNGKYGTGREGVRTFYDNVLRKFHCTMHLVANHTIDFDDDTHAHGAVYCRAQHHVVEPEPEHWFDEAYIYWDTYEKVGDDWFFAKRDLRAWYHQEFNHPDHGTDRIPPVPHNSAMRGAQMPEAFPTWASYWETPPRPIPGRQA
jgi:hypothetical protein